MAAAEKALYIEQGADFSMKLAFSDSSEAPIDVSGWTFSGQIRSKFNSSTVIASFTFSNTLNTNEKVASIPAATTKSIPVASASSALKKNLDYAYDMQAIKGDGTVVRIIEGIATVSPEVTKS